MAEEARTTEITGTIKNITFRNKETGYVVAKLDRNAICGIYNDTTAALEGAHIKAVGEWKKHKAMAFSFSSGS